MTEQRPDPDALLARVQEEEARKAAGRLKVFFGAAAGVGKTYAMLEAARRQRAEGVEVVIGWVETHGRAETAALLEGLEILPPQQVQYRGASLKEFDLDGALARHPALILVDELAHTNAPGARHAKRWQDVMELLDAGINVYTTLNVQHLESVNDLVAKITAVSVRETLPDSVLDRADEVELVDLPPDDLLRRLKEGKVYIPELAQEAVQNFFRKGNLIALRELALRHTADRVDAQMRQYMRDQAIGRTWPIAERLLVCIGPNPASARLVRTGKRMATALGAPWTVAYVETPAHARLSEEDRAQVVDTLRLAEALGADTVTLTGQRMSEEILAYARRRNVSRIVIGKPRSPLWRRILFGSIVDALIRGSGEIDIAVISGDQAEPTPLPRRAPPQEVDWPAYGRAAGAVLACTGVAWFAFPHFELANLIMVYLLGVLFVATHYGRGPSILASVLSVAAFDFFFVPPYFTFAVSDYQYLVTFAVMLTVALVISGLTVRIRDQAESARQRERRTAALYGMSRELASTRGVDHLLDAAVRHIAEVFGGGVAVLLPDGTGRLEVRSRIPAGFELNGNEFAVSQWVYEHGQMAGRGTATLPGAHAIYLPLLASRRTVGVLGIRPDDPDALKAPEQLHQLETFANQTALAVERAKVSEEAHEAAMRVEAERLRSSLLGSISHDLRTPLAAITGAATSLLDDGDRFSSSTQRELLQAIQEESEYLTRLVHNVLQMTRLESAPVDLHREWHSLEEIVGAALARCERALGDRPVQTDLPQDLPLVFVDDVLVEQVLINLLDNVSKYTPPGSPVEISARASARAVEVRVADRGPGFSPGAETRLFEKFYRVKTGGPRGVGLGLAICRAILTAHDGQIWAQNRPGGGALFGFTLPLQEKQPEVHTADG